MSVHFTKHAKDKFLLLKKSGFDVTEKMIDHIVHTPLKLEKRNDGTYIATHLFDKTHVLRVVYRAELDIMIIITFYPGRRKAYDI